LALLALKVELGSLVMESSFGRGIWEDEASVNALAGRLLLGVPRWVPVVDMLGKPDLRCCVGKQARWQSDHPQLLLI
jgi:hypothetical protein